MTAYGMWDLMVAGGILGMAVCWLLRLEVAPHWAACGGIAIVLLQPWASMTFGSYVSDQSFPSIVLGGGVAAALVAALQSMNSHW